MSSAAPPVLRFAPTPNGALHLGHAYSALLNQRLACEMGGRLLLRIEDLDRTRCNPQYERAIVDDLRWLGLTFDEPPRRQSEHGPDYAEALGRLEASGFAYPCFCSRSQVMQDSRGRRDPDGAPLYSRACRSLGPAERDARLARGEPAAIRLDMQRALVSSPPLAWIEYGEGPAPCVRPAHPEAWSDVVLRGRGLAASYHLAVVADDALQGVTDVVRGRDLLSATAVHRLLQSLLGFPAPRYRHHRLVLDASGAKLSKSRQSSSLAELREGGFDPGEIRAALGFEAGAGALSVAFS
jgi:glutamyl-Q tRNA(Asp) synthetase